MTLKRIYEEFQDLQQDHTPLCSAGCTGKCRMGFQREYKQEVIMVGYDRGGNIITYS